MLLTRALRLGVAVGSTLVCVSPAPVAAQGAIPQQPRRGPRAGAAPTKQGLILNSHAAFAGLTLFAPQRATTTYLVDMKGDVVHSWPSRYVPGEAVYLLDDGSVLRCAREPGNHHFGGGGIGGRVERIAPDGRVLWEFVYADEKHCLHHDIEPLPNGNILMITWEKKTRDEALAAGRDPEHMNSAALWPDAIIEVEPQGARGAKIVWEWHVWDHLVQSYDEGLPNYGIVADHPELIDLNFRPHGPRETPDEIRRLRALGYVGGGEPEGDEGEDGPPGPGRGGPDMRADWCHTNSVAYHAKLDQIALSVHNFNEVWIIDHSTTTEMAAGHSGGRYGRGGDLLYRWGNPRAYGAGDARDQQLFAQHDARWIPEGSPGAGHLLVFNNGPGRPDGQYSSVVEIAAPVDSAGRYALAEGEAFGPKKPCWEYAARDKASFFSHAISGAQRFPNGNTLICAGEQGRMFEVDARGKTVWEYVNPFREPESPAFAGGVRAHGPPAPRFRDGPPPHRRPRSPNGGRDVRRGPPGGGPMNGGVFRATRLVPDHPGVRAVLRASHRQ